jgi:hypothetical protein
MTLEVSHLDNQVGLQDIAIAKGRAEGDLRDAAIAAGERWPLAKACGRGDGAQKAFMLPISHSPSSYSLGSD